ncbi:unnamed protein product, partial [Heligmosomoides polygyrus]|uniref:Protein kinase domain-containing protein n=1 Tax=Heligmosomoides polygyrus TaxID=6339 RepID=A0A183GU45_HELPZ
KAGKICTISTQVRIGINVLHCIKQLHDVRFYFDKNRGWPQNEKSATKYTQCASQVGFVHRDVKPGNMALGLVGTAERRFIHILDFGLAREYIIVDVDGKTKMRRPRERAHFRGTVRYCSANAQERGEQGRPDDLWCLLYILVELRGALPWSRVRYIFLRF